MDESQTWNVAHTHTLPETSPDEATGTIEAFERTLHVAVGRQCYVERCVGKISGDRRARYRNAPDAGIGELLRDDLGHFALNLIGNTL